MSAKTALDARTGLRVRTARGVPAVAGIVLILLLSGCSLLTEFEGEPLCPRVVPQRVVEFLHTVSDERQQEQDVADFTTVVVPAAAQACAHVVVLATGANGLTAAQVIARADFDTNAVDGRNTDKRSRLVAERVTALRAAVTSGLAAIPYATASDPFGGYIAAAELLQQAHGAKVLTVYGDQLANRPPGCLLSVRDLRRVQELLGVCSPAVPSLAGVDVEVVGAGYSLGAPVSTATAQGLEPLLRAYFAKAGAHVSLFTALPARPIGKDD